MDDSKDGQSSVAGSQLYNVGKTLLHSYNIKLHEGLNISTKLDEDVVQAQCIYMAFIEECVQSGTKVLELLC